MYCTITTFHIPSTYALDSIHALLDTLTEDPALYAELLGLPVAHRLQIAADTVDPTVLMIFAEHDPDTEVRMASVLNPHVDPATVDTRARLDWDVRVRETAHQVWLQRALLAAPVATSTTLRPKKALLFIDDEKLPVAA